ncbi:WD40-repeat-containing domain protein [Chytridium lagenaria]|nr:WD40-repeat-containing domain protein [Chytridium lagenaria]
MALEKKKKALELIANTNGTNVLKDKATYRTEREMNLTHFRELMHIFQVLKTKSLEEWEKAMDMAEFKAAFGLVLGQGLSEDQMGQLFMKIDANTDNEVDWDEFSTFMLLRAERQSVMLEEATTTLFDLPPMIPAPHHQTPHREGIISIIYVPAVKKYVTCSREGTFCYWSEKFKLQRCFPFAASCGQNTRVNSLESVVKLKHPTDIKELKDIHLQNGRWVHDVVFMPLCNKFAVATDDHEITFYDFTTMEPQGSLDLQDSIALSLDFWSDPDNPDSDEGMLLYGTDQGYVITFTFTTTSLFSNRNKVKSQTLRINMESYFRNTPKNFGNFTKRKAHNDWVTRSGSTGFVGCCHSGREEQMELFFGTRASRVNVFAYCKFPVCLVTGGTDRQLRLWNPHRLHHPMAALKGHNAPIIDITINDLNGQILSLSSDKAVKVWDIRKQQCVQTIVDSLPMKAEEHISVIHFNPFLNGKLLTAATWLVEYNLKAKGPSISFASSKSHDMPLRSALFNVNFRQIVTACDGGVVNVWDAVTGQKTFRFSDTHSRVEITALTFDSGYRRLLTGGRGRKDHLHFQKLTCHKDGSIVMWNFNNGQILREFIKGDSTEVTGLAYIDLKDHQYIVATSSNRKVSIFLDDNDLLKLYPSLTYPTDPDATHGWHVDDIISMAFCKPNYLVTGGYDGEIILTNFQSGHVIHRMKWPGAEEKDNPNRSIDKVLFLTTRVENIAACSLLSSGADGFVRWWNITTGELYWEMDATNGRGEGIYSMCTNESNHLLAIADAVGNVKVFDIVDTCIDEREIISPPELISSFRAHTKCVVSIEFMDGDFLLTGSTDGTARIFTSYGDFVGTLGQDNLWDLSEPETYAHPLRPPDVEMLLARERLYTKKFKEVTHKLVLNLREQPNGDPIIENEPLPKIRSGFSSIVSRSSLTPSMVDFGLDYASRGGSRGSSFFSSVGSLGASSSSVNSSGITGSNEDFRRRPIATADVLAHGYSTWYGSTQYAKELHTKQPSRKTSQLSTPRNMENASRPYHSLRPHDLNEVVDVRSVPVLSMLAQRGTTKGIGMLFDSHLVEARSQLATRGDGLGKTGKDKSFAPLNKAHSLEAILSRALE